MCGRVKISGMTFGPGSPMIIESSKSFIERIWGTGEYYNTRLETIKRTSESLFLSILPVDYFFEGGAMIGLKEGGYMSLACVHGMKTFNIITQPAIGIVKKFHHRMPIVLSDPKRYLYESKIIQIDYKELIQIA